MSIATYNYKRVYVWELPVRFFHWILVICIFVLTITGFIIANPPAIASNAEASNRFLMGYVRFFHFSFAYIMIAAWIMRLYWAFVGNQFAEWKNFFPYTKKGLKNMFYVLSVDIFLKKDKEHKLSNISIGHNYMASFTYFLIFLLVIFQVSSGFALMSNNSTWFLPKIFGFLKGWFGGDVPLRYFHHLSTWMFIAFFIVHLYLVLYHDYIEARGETSAMLSGYKFVRAEQISTSEEEIIEQASKQMWEGKNVKEEETKGES